MSSCNQNNMFDSDDLPLALMFEEDELIARLRHSDGTQDGDEREPAVAEAVANLVDDTELSEVSTDEVEVSDSEDEFLPSPGNAFSSDEDFKRRRSLQVLRNSVHSNSPTAHLSTSEAEFAMTASLNTVMAISCAVDESVANWEASEVFLQLGVQRFQDHQVEYYYHRNT